MLEVVNLGVYYNDNLVLNNISFQIPKGKIVGIIGPNGAGKSTLLKSILNLIGHTGSVKLDKVDSKKKLRDVAYVEQKANIDFKFPIRVKECVSLGLYANMKVFQKLKASDWQKVDEALEKVNLLEYANRQIGELSGGQFQRVLLARCLVQNAEYIFLDEPFVGIDSVSEKIIMQLLCKLKEEGKTILIVHHDLSKVEDYFDDILILNRKLVAYGKVATTFNNKNLKQAYGENIFIEKVV